MSEIPDTDSYTKHDSSGVPVENFTSTHRLSNDLKAGITDNGLVYVYLPKELAQLAVLSKSDQAALVDWLNETPTERDYNEYTRGIVPTEYFSQTHRLSHSLKAGVGNNVPMYLYRPGPLQQLAILSENKEDQFANWLADN